MLKPNTPIFDLLYCFISLLIIYHLLVNFLELTDNN